MWRSPDRRAARVDRRYQVRFAVAHGESRVKSGSVVCHVHVGRRDVRVVSVGFSEGFAQCIFVAPRHTRGRYVTGMLTVTASDLRGRRWFSRLIR